MNDAEDHNAKVDIAKLIIAIQDGQKIRTYKMVAKILGCDLNEAMAVVRSMWLPPERLSSYMMGYHIGINKGREEADEELSLAVTPSVVVQTVEPDTNLWIIVWNHRHGQDIWPVFQDSEPTEEELAASSRVGGDYEPHREERFDVIGPFDPMSGEPAI